MTLYVKPGMDGRSIGDCPFAHFVRMVLSEKGLEYDLVPSTPESKPRWLVDDYSGKMPALRHRRECYVDSDVIAQYLDFFFPEPTLSYGGGGSSDADDADAANVAVDGLFSAMARYVKHRPNGDDEDDGRRTALMARLRALENHLDNDEARTGPYLVGDGERFTLLDCSMAPKLYAMDVCIRDVKENSIDIAGEYPRVRKYMDDVFERPSFRSTVEYGPETVVWGWTSHLNSS